MKPCNRPIEDLVSSRRARGWTLRSLLVVGLSLLSALVGCARSGSEPTPSCLFFYASNNLNLFENESHPVTVYVYPLSSPADFQRMSVEDLLERQQPKGALGPSVPVTVSPGEERGFQELFPPQTNHLGLLADFYRAPGDPEGKRTHVVEAGCGWFSTTSLVLSPRDIYPK